MYRYLPIRRIYAREVLDSRSNPTVEVEVTVGEGIMGVDGYTGRAIVPSGASTGKYEAVELRDGEERFGGLGVEQAVRNVNVRLAEQIVGENALNQSYIDKTVAEFHDVFIANPDYFPFTEKEIRLQKLTDYPLIVLERNCTTTEFLRRLFLQHHLELMPAIELSSNDLLIDLARIGLGIAFVPDYCVQNASDDLTVLRIRESMPARQMTACVNPSMPVNESTRNFLELLPTVQS